MQSRKSRVKCCKTGCCLQTKRLRKICGQTLRCPSASVAILVFNRTERFCFGKAFYFGIGPNFKRGFMKFLVSDFLSNLSASKKIAFISLFTALSTISNMYLEVRIFDVQYSLTIAFSFFNGLFLGSMFGFITCFLGDLIGYLINNWGQLYMPWVGISTGMFAFISGSIFYFKSKSVGKIFVKLAIFSLLSFLICTILINSTGFYFYNRKIGFSDAVLSYAENLTGKKEAGFLTYLGYRLIFKGQIFNSIFNYALIFLIVPLLKKLPISSTVF